MKKKVNAAAVQRLVSNLVATGPVEWDTIVKAIADQYEVTDWLVQVRGPMQAMKDAEEIHRTADLRREIYAKGKRP